MSSLADILRRLEAEYAIRWEVVPLEVRDHQNHLLEQAMDARLTREEIAKVFGLTLAEVALTPDVILPSTWPTEPWELPDATTASDSGRSRAAPA